MHRRRLCRPVLLLALSLGLGVSTSRAQDAPVPDPAATTTFVAEPTLANAPPDSIAPGAAGESADDVMLPDPSSPDTWSRPFDEDPTRLPDDVIRIDQPLYERLPDPNGHSWHWAPTGLIYHSYMAGVHEPRMALFTFSDLDDGFLWDATLGGRAGLLRYGNDDPVNPAGYQLDFYGAAIARLDAQEQQDLQSCDYVFGFPVTWGDKQWQWKLGYAHLSSHLGDEYARQNPGALNNRINYVRDSFVFGTSYFIVPNWRLYGETGWAFNASGGAEPWDAQFGTEYARPAPPSCWTPFVAVNGRLREELGFGGDVSIQAGWLQRGILDQTIRLGAQFYSGKSSQFQFYTRNEQQLGIGVWYDF